ncbi:aminopeptidase P N-terminal domain-containing protein [Pseudoduganella namucuonensis]|uniref:Xaa-Pro aminopeptidase n=1 Tax=Pseudoduganella namucuonensis TaxID=1035707 RepID=A0A1I7L2U6_9BURK|nr:aminopeptidase P N-terminal domain-containing protein [Pseudoduganella namucuonensis]SFV04079.1 aminopeptidase P Metallo peptidase. MEROPS family M24B [Pseudoduganella namucuonensis]
MQPYHARRAQLIERMRANGGGVAVIPTATEVMRNNDVEYPFRHDSYFHYLSGITEPDAVIVLVAGARSRAILFCRDKDPEREIWHGFRHGPEGARGHYGFDEAFAISALDDVLPTLLAEAPALYAGMGRDAAFDDRLHGWLHGLRRGARAGVRVPSVTHDVNMIMDEMRLLKSGDELGVMRRAAAISAEAHLRAMRATRPGLAEYQIEAELIYEFHRQGAAAPAYPSIVAAGANACVLHHNPGRTRLRDGELLLIDAGCEYDGYASDITRTFPANGVFSPAQREIYDIVLEAQLAAIAAVRAGAHVMSPHEAAVRVLAQGMLDTGLLKGDQAGSADDVVAGGGYRRFFMCRTSHWLGMDVHDVGGYREPGREAWRVLRPGMTLTVEPGLYIRPAPDVPERYWNIGVRIEDDVAVTPSGGEVMSAGAPKSVDEIEAAMRGR